MSEYDYREGMKIDAMAGFYALLFAAIRKADLANRDRLARVFPEEVAEFYRLQNGGRPVSLGKSINFDDIERMIEDAELAGRD